jgi:Fe-S oxidoreductase
VTRIFDSPVTDVSEYVLDRWSLETPWEFPCFYHAPCHDSLHDKGAALLGSHGFQVTPVPHCCSQAGTLALSRPDISHNMLVRKQGALARENGITRETRPEILTNCPSCLQGLGRVTGVQPVHLAEALARAMGGDDWKARHLAKMAASMEKVTF